MDVCVLYGYRKKIMNGRFQIHRVNLSYYLKLMVLYGNKFIVKYKMGAQLTITKNRFLSLTRRDLIAYENVVNKSERYNRNTCFLLYSIFNLKKCETKTFLIVHNFFPYNL